MTRGRVSVLIPARQEPQLVPTVRDCLAQATGDLEVVVALDGWWPKELVNDPRVHYLHWGEAKGLRPSLNAAKAVATGEFLFKLDGHCCLQRGYDEALKQLCGDSEIVVPAKRSLDVATWSMHRDPWWYYYYLWPWEPQPDGTEKFKGLQDRNFDPALNAELTPRYGNDILTFQGSAWMIRRTWWERILPAGMDERYYYAAEPVELGLTTWVNGGRVRIAKSVEYGHLAKGQGEHKRQFARDKRKWRMAMEWATKLWMAHPGFPALIARFGPFPGWPEDWQAEAQRRFA